MKAVTTSAHLTVHTLAILISSWVDPAVRCLACEVAHEPPTIAQHPILCPMALGSSTVITEVLRPNVGSGSEDEVLRAGDRQAQRTRETIYYNSVWEMMLPDTQSIVGD